MMTAQHMTFKPRAGNLAVTQWAPCQVVSGVVLILVVAVLLAKGVLIEVGVGH